MLGTNDRYGRGVDFTALLIALLSTALAIFSLREARRTAARQSDSDLELEKLRHQFDRDDRALARTLELEDRLEAHREPLIEVVEELRRRISNIREGAFLATYLESDETGRHDLALLGTEYRFGAYWATVAGLRAGLSAWELDRYQSTADVTRALVDVERAFSDDGNPELMVWREEQRAIGELLLGADARHPIGFAEFAARYETDLGRWFASIRSDLERADVADGARLPELDGRLAALQLVLVGHRPVEPNV